MNLSTEKFMHITQSRGCAVPAHGDETSVKCNLHASTPSDVNSQRKTERACVSPDMKNNHHNAELVNGASRIRRNLPLNSPTFYYGLQGLVRSKVTSRYLGVSRGLCQHATPGGRDLFEKVKEAVFFFTPYSPDNGDFS